MENPYQTNNYCAYGLNISSEISCPELSPGTGKADLHIRHGEIEGFSSDISHSNFHFQTSTNRIIMDIKNVARYLISEGNAILISRYPKSNDAEIRLYLLGSVMGTILLQRGILPLHGNGIVYNGECIIFLGHTGRGKSTLSAAFRKRGYSLMSDDICAIKTYPDKRPLVYPGIPHIKLTQEVAKKLGEQYEKLKQITPSENKYILPVKNEFLHRPVTLARIYILNIHDNDNIKLLPVNGVESIKVIKNHTYRKFILRNLGKASIHFKMCGFVARDTPVTRVIRPRNKFLLDELIELLEKDFK